MSTASAPGKIILFGEHAVVYGRPALAVPVTQVQATVTVEAGAEPGVWLEAPGIDLRCFLSSLPADHPLAAAVYHVVAALGRSLPESLKITIHSTIPVASGLGSGAAVSVALIRALSAFLGQPLPDERVSALAYEVEKIHHGTPSGIDNTVITYARPVYFVKGRPIETFHAGQPFSLVIADTGIPAPTREAVGDVRKLWEAHPEECEKIFDEIGQIADLARQKITSGEWQALGELMDRNHLLLRQLTVSCPALDRLVQAARQAGALGAKLSGGGRGGNMIALIDKENAPAVTEALKSAGARRTIVTQVGEITAG